MSQQTSRRAFLAGATALALPLPKAQAATPQFIVPALTLLAGAHPLLAIATIIEVGLDAAMDATQKPKLDDIASSVVTIAQKQNIILTELAQQRLVMRQELKQAFLNNDVRDLLAVSTHFQVVLDDEKNSSSAIQDLAGRTIETATKLSTYGIAGVPAYLNAVALVNAVHHVAGSPPKVFLTINEVHKNAMSEMLYGKGPDSIDQLRVMLAKSDTRPSNPLLEVGKHYPLWGAIRMTTASAEDKIHWSATAYGVIYQGFKNGRVILQPYNQPLTSSITQEEFDQFKYDTRNTDSYRLAKILPHVNQRFAGDWNTIPELTPTSADAYPYINLDDAGHFELDANSKSVADTQINAVANYYSRMYTPDMGDINAQTVKDLRGPSDGLATQMSQLLASGLGAVNGIIDKKNIELASLNGTSLPPRSDSSFSNSNLAPLRFPTLQGSPPPARSDLY